MFPYYCVGSVQTVFQDPSFESHQPKCVRKTFHRNRQMIISPSPSTDSAGIEEVDSGLDFLYEMEEMSVITGTSGDFTVSYDMLAVHVNLLASPNLFF